MNATSGPLDAAIGAWLHGELASPARAVFFEAHSMSDVWGVELADGRRVAVKRRGGGDRLAIVAQAHRAAQSAGIDTPTLLAGPHELAHDVWLTIEQWRPDGAPMPAGDAPVLFANLLARLSGALKHLDATGLTAPPWLHYDHGTDRIWPPPASARWDPHRIESELPDDLVRVAAAARARLLASDLPVVLGHADLNGLNVRWLGDHPIVHDWDSVALLPEAVLVGAVAVNWVEQLNAGAICDIATGHRVIAAYERAVGQTLSADEREVAWATTAWLACYNAAFEFLHGAPGAVAEHILRDGDARLALANA